MYHRIVVPLDGSELAEGAVSEAVELARNVGDRLHLLRVVDSTWVSRYGLYGLAIETSSVDGILRADRAAATSYLDHMQTRLESTGIPVTSERREGRAADEIVAAVRPGDLIVMASHGRTGALRFALGSVAEDVARHATAPVLLCRVAHNKHMTMPEQRVAEAAFQTTNGM